MKAAVLSGPGRMEIRDVDDPVMEKDEILIKLKSCGICTLEQRLFTGAMKLHYPLVGGHEAAGEIVEVGKAVIGSFSPGTKVALDLVTRCGECYYCRIGKSNLCSNRFNPGQRMLGGFAEFIAAKPNQVYALPTGLSFDEAAFTEPLSCCVHSLKRLKVAMTEDLLIVGAGVMGLLHLLVARCMGLRTTVCDPDASRLEIARALGADFTVNPRTTDLSSFGRENTDGLGWSSCVIASPAPEALKEAVASLAKCARLNIYTAYEGEMTVPIDATAIHRQELTVTGTEGRLSEDFFQAARLLSFGKVKVDALISGRTSFSTIEQGFREAISGHAFRIILNHEAP